MSYQAAIVSPDIEERFTSPWWESERYTDLESARAAALADIRDRHPFWFIASPSTDRNEHREIPIYETVNDYILGAAPIALIELTDDDTEPAVATSDTAQPVHR